MLSKQQPTPAEYLLRECLMAINEVPNFAYEHNGTRKRSYALASEITKNLREAGYDPYKPDHWQN
jgi:hypothetical protein